MLHKTHENHTTNANKIHTYQRPKTVDCIFIGYAHNSTAYRFLAHESNIPDIHKNTMME